MILAIDDAHLDDFIQIRKDRLQYSPGSFHSDPSEIIDPDQTRKDLQAKNKENFILFYLQENKVAGMLGFMRYTRVKIRHKAFIWGVFVYPQFRGLGIGKQLLEETIRRAEQLEGLRKINLTVSAYSTNAIQLYRQLGFVEYGREAQSVYWKGEWFEELFMEKLLWRNKKSSSRRSCLKPNYQIKPR